MLYPVFPTSVTQTLGASPAVLGLIEGAAEGTASIGKAVSGRLADRFRRRPMIALGYGISAVAKPLIGVARAWRVALVGRFVDRSGKGLRDSPRDALLVADTSRKIRGRGFGFQRAFDTAGAVVGPLMGLGLYEAFSHRIRPLFFVALLPGAISAALFFLVNASYSALSLPAGIVSDPIPRRVVYGTGLLVFAVAYVGLGLARSSVWVWLLFALYGGYGALTDGVGRAWVADLSPSKLVGTGLGLYQGLIGVCVLIAGVWAGVAWDGNGRLALIASGAVVGLLAVGLLTVGRRLDPSDA